jgi:cytochrome c
MMKNILKAAAVLSVLVPAGAAHAQDAAAGEKVFRKCKACHVVDKEQNRVGPHLVGIIGRPVAAIEDFRYSSAMEEWGEGKTWDDALFLEYIEKPRTMVKGTKMAFAGLRDEQERKDILAYLKEAAAGS